MYEEGKVPFVMDRANVLNRQEQGADVLIVACGEMVRPSLDAVSCLAEEGIRAEVIDMYCVKPLDTSTLLKEAGKARAVVTVEEHSPFGGLGSMVSQAVAGHCPKKVINLSLPDSPVVSGTSREVFDYYGLNAAGITAAVKEALER